MFRLLLQPFKQQYSKKTTIGDLAYPMAVKSNWKLSIIVVEYPREYEYIFETALAHESVEPGVLFDEKIERFWKSRETVPLSIELFTYLKVLIKGVATREIYRMTNGRKNEKKRKKLPLVKANFIYMEKNYVSMQKIIYAIIYTKTVM
jgi:hypothetical protein